MSKTFRKIWKKFWQPLLGLPIVQWILAFLMAVAIGVVYITSRKSIVNNDILEKYSKKPAIYVFWHGRSMMLSPIIRLDKIKTYAVASRHKDGRMMAKLQRLFGLRAIYGSTSKGGVSVLRQGVRAIRNEKASICLSPDGPSGPSLRVKDGALYFAKMTGAPIIPVCFSASGSWIQKRWDRYFVALPFSKIICKIGEPVFVNPKATDEEFQKVHKDLENAMVQQVREMDTLFNLPVVEQDLTASEFKKKMRAQKKNKSKKTRR